MVGIGSVLQFQYPASVPGIDWRVQNDSVADAIVFWNTGSLGTQPTEPELLTIQASAAYQTYLTPAAVEQRQRDKAAAAVVTEKPLVWIRAAAAVLVDEINVLRQWEMSLKAGIAAATSLADVKTAVAALPNLPDRTLAQAKTAIQNKITTGVAD